LLALKQVEAEPAAIGAGDTLRLAKEGNEEQEHEVGVHSRLQLQIPGEVLAGQIAFSSAKGERRVQGVIDLFHERDEVPDIRVAQPAPRIMALELLDQPSRIVDPDEEIVPAVPQEGPRQLAQFPRLRAGERGEVVTAILSDEAVFQCNSRARIRALEEPGDLGE
jgi:hypothetical protein